MLDPDIQTLVRMGDVIGAIGLYQQRHGGSTLVARKAIDAFRSELAQETTPGFRIAAPSPPASVTVVDDPELDAALRDGHKITAIKRYRELYGVGLKAAKDAVEAMQAGEAVATPPPLAAGTDLSLLQPELDRLIAAGHKIEAIKHVRTVTGLGLRESKDAVEVRIAEIESSAPDRSELQPELDRLIATGHKIMAIKHYRDITQVGLKEAKDAVEARMAELAR